MHTMVESASEMTAGYHLLESARVLCGCNILREHIGRLAAERILMRRLVEENEFDAANESLSRGEGRGEGRRGSSPRRSRSNSKSPPKSPDSRRSVSPNQKRGPFPFPSPRSSALPSPLPSPLPAPLPSPRLSAMPSPIPSPLPSPRLSAGGAPSQSRRRPRAITQEDVDKQSVSISNAQITVEVLSMHTELCRVKAELEAEKSKRQAAEKELARLHALLLPTE
jgi:uncharacterized small protein (DUF1192 family)